MERALIRVLLIEDDEDDYVITSELLSEVAGAQFKLDWVATSGEALAAMQRNEHDVYLLDYRLGERDGLDLLREAIEARVRAPIIMLTGREDRDVDVAAMNSGAADYLVKEGLTASALERSIRYSIEQKRLMEEQARLVLELQEALARVRTLSGLLPICAHCKNIRDDRGYWNQLEDYLTTHSGIEFSHGICPPCFAKLYPDFTDGGTGPSELPEVAESADILLVDDNPVDVKLTLYELQKKNLANRIHVASDGAEALEFVFGTCRHEGRNVEDRPKLILLDLRLPKIDGLEVLRRLKADLRTRMIPVVVLTSSRQEQDIIDSHRLGAVSYIVKPIDFVRLSEAVASLGLQWMLIGKPPEPLPPGGLMG
jgi:CheY-like chemotaxis protein